MPDLTVGPPGTIEVDVPAPSDTAEAGELGAELAGDVDELTVRALLAGAGGLANIVARHDDAPDLWKLTPGELDALTPPLTRIINRRPALRAAVARGDEAVVLAVLAQYAGRNVRDLRAARRDTDDADLCGEDHGPGAGGGANAPRAPGDRGRDAGNDGGWLPGTPA